MLRDSYLLGLLSHYARFTVKADHRPYGNETTGVYARLQFRLLIPPQFSDVDEVVELVKSRIGPACVYVRRTRGGRYKEIQIASLGDIADSVLPWLWPRRALLALVYVSLLCLKCAA